MTQPVEDGNTNDTDMEELTMNQKQKMELLWLAKKNPKKEETSSCRNGWAGHRFTLQQLENAYRMIDAKQWRHLPVVADLVFISEYNAAWARRMSSVDVDGVPANIHRIPQFTVDVEAKQIVLSRTGPSGQPADVDTFTRDLAAAAKFTVVEPDEPDEDDADTGEVDAEEAEAAMDGAEVEKAQS